MMGFDSVDRTYRKTRIVPECVECAATGTDVKLRYEGEDDEKLMCIRCYCDAEIAQGFPF